MKQSFSDLAILGGTPAFAMPLHVGRPNIGDRRALLTRINDLLDRRWLTNNGPFVQEFEQQDRRLPGRQALHRHVQRHRGAGDRHSRPGTARRGDRPLFYLHRHRPRAAVAGDHAGLLRRGPGHPQPGPGQSGGDDHPAHHRHHGRARVGPAVRHRGVERDRRAPRPEADVRRRPRLRQLLQGPDDRQLRRRRRCSAFTPPSSSTPSRAARW